MPVGSAETPLSSVRMAAGGDGVEEATAAAAAGASGVEPRNTGASGNDARVEKKDDGAASGGAEEDNTGADVPRLCCAFPLCRLLPDDDNDARSTADAGGGASKAPKRTAGRPLGEREGRFAAVIAA
jgi:hypothetical protein